MITGACMFYLFNSLFVSSAAGRLTVQPSPQRPSILDLAEEITDNGHHHDEKPTARVTRTRGNQQNFHGRVQRYFHTAYQILLLNFSYSSCQHWCRSLDAAVLCHVPEASLQLGSVCVGRDMAADSPCAVHTVGPDSSQDSARTQL